MAESSSDVEAPLLISEEPHEPQSPQSPKSGDLANVDPKRKWKERSFRTKGMRSGRFQFQYHRSASKQDYFAKTDGITRGEREYKKKQLEALKGFQEVDDINGKEKETCPPGTPESDPAVDRAINLSNGLNVVLLAVKIYASVKTGSLAIAASTLDSLLDFLAGLVLWFTYSYMKTKNQYKYPIGKLRIQPVGIVIFAAIMATLGLQVLITGVEQLVEEDKHSMDDDQRLWLIIIMGAAILIKLALYIYCRTFDNEIVNVFALDHFFDVVTNIVGLAAALLAEYFYWWIDPTGAIFLALYTIFNWGKTVLENAVSLVGKAAPPEVMQKLIYMALNHDSRIRRIDTVRAYTFGAFYFVEVDIELPEDMVLKDTHEIGESLQNKLELLPEVERAFVHVDYESSHRPEHYAAIEFKH